MLTLGTLGFAAPWALAALALLPALWWLLRVTPPTPKRVVFPPVRLLAALVAREETSTRTPPWLLALRLLLATALILGAAGPVVDSRGALPGDGPLYLLADDGWAAARDWPKRQAELAALLDRAERQQRSVVLVPTAPAAVAAAAADEPPGPLPAARVRELVLAMTPKPWPTDRAAAVEALLRRAETAGWRPGAVVWVADGLEEPAGRTPVGGLAERLRERLGPVAVHRPEAPALPLLLQPGRPVATGPELTLLRPAPGSEQTAAVRMIGEDGAPLARQDVRFAAGETRAVLRIELPTELSGRLARAEIEGQGTAGAVVLLDDRWQRRAIGITGEPATAEQPLLGGGYYVERAVQPFAEVRRGDVATLLARPLAVMVMLDVGAPDPLTADAVGRWVEQGGVLLRFAGPRLAAEATGEDALLPVPLRGGERQIGGSLSWTSVGRVAPFEAAGPFAGLAVPRDLEIRRQVIAEPSLDAAERTWARLDDGTPLISGARRGDGWLVLIHTTATPDWSSLPLSGLFVDLLRRIAALAQGSAAEAGTALLPPLESLDGFGRLGPPPPGAAPIAPAALATTTVDRRHPPGFYGTGEARRALNLAPAVGTPTALGALPADVEAVPLGAGAERDLRPWLLAAALLLAVVDLAASLWLRGLFRRGGPPPTPAAAGAGTAAAVLLAVSLAATPAAAAETIVADGTAVPASLSTRLAWVRSGDARVDAVSAAGLAGLSALVNRRTAAELGEPVGVDPERDELAFYPLLYWPLADGVRPPSPLAARRVADYMRAGGTVVFDARGRDTDRAALRALARALDLPQLVPVADEHVLRRSYYLLGDMPGRRTGAAVWVEQTGEHVNDGVSSVVAGSNDWAGAWAVDESQRPMFPVVPGGERQREHAYRFGVNLVMYVLTGNYKADQVHLPAILERLGP